MVKKCYCDLCKKEFDTYNIVTSSAFEICTLREVTVNFIVNDMTDLCHACKLRIFAAVGIEIKEIKKEANIDGGEV